jgi:uncharacterized membrane protein YdbT with pleckstrin-like domain
MEQPLDSFRSSTFGWLRGTLAGCGTFLVGLAGIIGALIGDWGLTPLLLTGLGLAIVLVKWVQNLATTYEVTPDRLIIRRGIFVKSIDEVELYRVKDIRIDFTLINQWANIGTVTLLSSDETTRDTPLALRHIDAARRRREDLRTLVDAARQKRRVREIDMVHEDL